MNDETRQRVFEHIEQVMNAKIESLTIDNPFVPDDIEIKNPFGFRLVPLEVWQGSKFERSFVTTLGQNIFETIGRIIAEGTGAIAINQHQTEITINTFQNETIDTIIQQQRRSSGTRRAIESPNIQDELDDLGNLNNQSFTSLSIISDLYIERQDGRQEFYSLKTVKPNLDQTAVAKRDLLALRTADPNYEAYFVLPYNPAGEGNAYQTAGHGIPRKLFDMEDENFVLMGSSLWNKIGDSPNTYNELLNIFEEVGEISSERIRREYFGL